MNLIRYHEHSKHHLDRYAPGPGRLDWATQPDPFRHYAGASTVALPLGADALTRRFDEVRRGTPVPPAPFDRRHVGLLLELSLALSAWKAHGGSRWALRCNPSSGNLHPVEAVLVVPTLEGLDAGVWHYDCCGHALQQRLVADGDWAQAWSTGPGFFVALTAIA